MAVKQFTTWLDRILQPFVVAVVKQAPQLLSEPTVHDGLVFARDKDYFLVKM